MSSIRDARDASSVRHGRPQAPFRAVDGRRYRSDVRRLRFLPLPILAAAVAAQVDPELAVRIVQEGIGNSQVMQFQDELCQDIGHRLTGSDNMTLACAWARDQFAAMGLDARLEPWDEWPLVWNRGQWMGRVLEPEALELQVATPAWTAPTKGQQKGRIVVMPSTNDDVAELVTAGEPLWLYGGRPSERSTAWRRLQPLLDRGLLLGTLQSAKSTRLTDLRFPDQIRVFGDNKVARLPYEDRPRVPHVIVRDDQADRIEHMLGGGQTRVIAQFEIRNHFRRGPIQLTNVIADLRGRERPEEMVIVCAHLDSWHQATGATDNGTGTCSTLEAARILAAVGAHPRRTIRFILWTGEEQGLLGSRAYVVRHRQEMKSVSAVFNHDSGTNWVHHLTIAEAMKPAFDLVAAPVYALPAPQAGHEGPTFVLQAQPEMPVARGGSDHASFCAVGVPAWGWGLTGPYQYGYGWHSQWDTYDLVDGTFQAHNATVFALIALGVAELPDMITREGVPTGTPARDATELAEGRLGVTFDDLRITAVQDGGVAARAGVRAGDVLDRIDDTPLERPVDVWRLLRPRDDLAGVVLVVTRDGREVRLTVPAAPAAEARRAEPVIR